MRLTLFNGSPRGVAGNTTLLMDHFLRGLTDAGDHQIETCYLKHEDELEEHVTAFVKSECVILAFPLYTDAMPMCVKRFIEALEPLRERKGNPVMGFFIQSGFPEGIHTKYVARYMEKLTRRLNSTCAGVMRKGGGEAVRHQPDKASRKLFEALYQQGRHFSQHQRCDTELIEQMAKPETFPPAVMFALKIMVRLGILNFMWDKQLKQNGAFEKRFDKPLRG